MLSRFHEQPQELHGYLGGDRASNGEHPGGEGFDVRNGQSGHYFQVGNRENPHGDRPSNFSHVSGFQSSDLDQRGRVGIHEQLRSDHRGAQSEVMMEMDGVSADDRGRLKKRRGQPTQPCPNYWHRTARMPLLRSLTGWQKSNQTLDWGSFNKSFRWGDQTMQGTMRAYQTWLALERLRLTAPQPNLEHLGHPHCGLPQSCKRCFDATALVDGKSACSHLEYPKTCMVVFHSVVVCLENLEEL